MRKIFLTILLLIIFSFTSKTVVQAMFLPDVSKQMTPGDSSEASLGAFDSPFDRELVDQQTFALGSFNFANLSYLVEGLRFSLVGFKDPQAIAEAKKLGYQNTGGAVGAVGNLIAGLITQPPVSTDEYLADLGRSLGVKPAYAQGTGWTFLHPVIEIWKAFRNLAYLAFVLIFVIVGFMIMFRAKINPQTVISIETAIPSLIITLVVITFSYAIASLMVDLIYVSIYLAIAIFSSAGIIGVGKVEVIKADLLGKNVISLLFSGPILGGGQSVVGAAASAIGETVENILWGGQRVGGNITGVITGGLAYLIIAVALVFAMFKLFFQLLLSYVGIIVSVIFAPLQLLGNALPGSNALSNWLKNLLANVLVFPATAVLFLIAAALTNSSTWGAGSGVGFSGEGGGGGLPLLYSGDVLALRGLIGLGMIMMAPKVVEMIKNALKVEKGAGMGGALAPIFGVAGLPGQALQQAVGVATARHYLFPSAPEPRLTGLADTTTKEAGYHPSVKER